MNRGDVVYVDWLFSDRQGSKVRPAIVVQADFLNSRIADTILVLVSRTSRAPGQTEVLLDPAVETNSGLQFVPVASCANLVTIDQGLVLRKVGELSVSAMQQIDQALELVLELP